MEIVQETQIISKNNNMEKYKTKYTALFMITWVTWVTWVFVIQLNMHIYDWRFYASLTSMIIVNIGGILALYTIVKKYKNT
jgi:membrane protein YdbS with pleckstrin-like domain